MPGPARLTKRARTVFARHPLRMLSLITNIRRSRRATRKRAGPARATGRALLLTGRPSRPGGTGTGALGKSAVRSRRSR
jgi:hypothetical protein